MGQWYIFYDSYRTNTYIYFISLGLYTSTLLFFTTTLAALRWGASFLPAGITYCYVGVLDQEATTTTLADGNHQPMVRVEVFVFHGAYFMALQHHLLLVFICAWAWRTWAWSSTSSHFRVGGHWGEHKLFVCGALGFLLRRFEDMNFRIGVIDIPGLGILGQINWIIFGHSIYRRGMGEGGVSTSHLDI